MATNQVYHISGLLEKMTNVDKDFRYMAVNDLMAELSKQSITLDEDMERRIVRALLALIQDKNGEVQNLACRCLGPLIHKIKLGQLENLVDALCANMVSQHEQLRDVSSIALKTVLNELPSGTVTSQMFNCVKRVVPKLIDALRTEYKGNSSVKLEVLDMLGSLIMRYGRTVNLMFEEIENILFLQLERERQTMRKRAIVTLGHLSDVVTDEQFTRIVEKVISICADTNTDLNSRKTFIVAASAICRTSGARFAQFLPKIVPFLIQQCENVEDDELREICLQAFEIFAFRCTTELTPFISKITEISKELLVYDPNYNYGSEEDTTDEMETEQRIDDEEEIEDQEDAYSDDDDLSWKVRRAAAKCIEALITFRAEKLSESYDNFGQLLIMRFREREENVKYDVFAAYSGLLKLTKQLNPELAVFQSQNTQSTNEIMIETFPPSRFQHIREEELSTEQKEIFTKLEMQIPSLVRSLQKQLHDKNTRTRLHAFTILSHLIKTFPGVMDNYLSSIVNDITRTLTESSSDGSMKIEILRFISLLLNTHEPEGLEQFVEAITPHLATSVGDNFYKIAGESLLTIQSLLRVLHSQKAKRDVGAQLSSIYLAVISKLKIADIDQEVKEKNIATAGLLISLFATELGTKISDECLPLFMDRLRNEMTRQVTLRAINNIVQSPVKLDLQTTLAELLTLCADFLRKNQRSLRLNTLTLLESLVRRFSHNGLQGPSLVKVVKEIPALINEQDLQIALLAITFITNVVNSYPDQILADSLCNLFNSLIPLIHSSLLQGSTLNATLVLLTALIRSPLPNKPTFEQILERISEPIYNASSTQFLHRQVYSSIAKATATIVQSNADQQRSTKLVLSLQDSFHNSARQANDSVRLFSVLTLGELGRLCRSVFESLEDRVKVESLIVEAFESQLEEIKSAASYALGSLAIGNLSKYLPFLLDEISKEEGRRQYLFLHALKEVINSECGESGTIEEADEAFKQGTEQIWSLLMKYCCASEESIRSVVAECVGRLIMVNPERYVSELLSYVSSPVANVRATVINALRFIVVEQPRPVDNYLRPVIGKFLNAVRDKDMNVRRVAIVTLNSAAHNKPKMIRDCLPTLLPALYEETKVKEELVHEVEMGPFKHIVDDGLDLRKAAFECMYTLADQSLDRVNVNEYLSYVENGLKDQHDIKLLTYLMLVRLVHKCPIQMAQRLDVFCEYIKPQLLLRPKQNAVKQENDKQDELKRSAVRAVIALRKIPNSERSQKMTDLWEIINSNPDLTQMKEMQTREQQLWTSVNGFGSGHEAMEVE